MTNQKNLEDEEEGGRSISRGYGDMVFLCGIHKLQYKYVYFVPRIKNLMETFIFSKIPLIFPVIYIMLKFYM